MKRTGCTPEQRAVCPLKECFIDTHHRFWPRRAYESGVAYQFRELPENKEDMCRSEHNELHRTEAPPRKPPEWYMDARIRLAQQAVAEVIGFEESA